MQIAAEIIGCIITVSGSLWEAFAHVSCTACFSTGTPDLVDFNWDVLGFQLVPTDFMYLMRCSSDGVFTNGELVPYGPIELNPAAAVLNYGQVCVLRDLPSRIVT